MMKENQEYITENIQNTLTLTSSSGTSVPAIINEIDDYYKQGAIAYAEGVSRYNVEIEKLLNCIEKAVNDKQEEEKILLGLEQELAIDNRVLEQLQDEFMQKLHSIEELNTEYKELVDEAAYTKLLVQKRRELYKTEDKIEELEITYLSHELERINMLTILEPKRHYVDTLKENIKELELEREHFASTKLHQLPQLGLSNNENTEEIVETSILENES